MHISVFHLIIHFVYTYIYSGAIKFATFELSKVFVEARTPIKFHPIAQFICAAGAMLACSVVLVPGEVLKTRLQAGMVSIPHSYTHIHITSYAIYSL